MNGEKNEMELQLGWVDYWKKTEASWYFKQDYSCIKKAIQMD
jgi:hypothetical protein